MHTATRYTGIRAITGIAMTLLAGCIASEPPLPPREALELAAARMDAVLADATPDSIRVDAYATDETNTPIELWYCAHPILAPVVSYTDWLDDLRREHPGITFDVDTQYLGEWSVGVQKLSVNLAVDDPPDIALVERGWLAALAHGGRLQPLDELLPPALVGDLRSPFRETLSIDGHLYALPADGFVSLLLSRGAVGEVPPKTWDELREACARIPDSFDHALGYVPFEELLWSAGGTLCDDQRSHVREPQALEALTFLLDLRIGGALHPSTWQSPLLGWQAFQRNHVAMTVASSKYVPQLVALDPNGTAAPVPGKTGPVSRLSEFALVVFARRDPAKDAAIVAILDYLTGPRVQGSSALAQGSLPVRTSVADQLDLPPWDDALNAAHNTPLVANWSPAEHELSRTLALAYAWADRR